MERYIICLLICILLFAPVSAQLGYDNPELPRITAPEKKTTTTSTTTGNSTWNQTLGDDLYLRLDMINDDAVSANMNISYNITGETIKAASLPNGGFEFEGFPKTGLYYNRITSIAQFYVLGYLIFEVNPTQAVFHKKIISQNSTTAYCSDNDADSCFGFDPGGEPVATVGGVVTTNWQDKNMTTYGNITATDTICDKNGCIGSGGGNPFDQTINTTSNVTFDGLRIGETFGPSFDGVSIGVDDSAGKNSFTVLGTNTEKNHYVMYTQPTWQPGSANGDGAGWKLGISLAGSNNIDDFYLAWLVPATTTYTGVVDTMKGIDIQPILLGGGVNELYAFHYHPTSIININYSYGIVIDDLPEGSKRGAVSIWQKGITDDVILETNNVTLSGIPWGATTATSYYLCADTDGRVFKNETGC